ncbi:MAG: hypothetical protein ABJG47_17840 [Ekhidna sp.]
MESKNLSQHQLQSLGNLFESVSPKDLHASIEDLFFNYLSEKDVVYPSHEMVRHVYYLLLFLREVEGAGSSLLPKR